MSVQSLLESSGRVLYDHGLPGENLDSYIDKFIAASSEDPFTTWLLLPTERLVREVTDRFTKKDIPIIPSRVCTLKSFCQVLFEDNRTTQRFLSKGESKLLLAAVLEEHSKEVPLFINRDHPSPGTIDDLMTFMNVTLTGRSPRMSHGSPE
jgi:hypothetical protein